MRHLLSLSKSLSLGFCMLIATALPALPACEMGGPDDVVCVSNSDCGSGQLCNAGVCEDAPEASCGGAGGYCSGVSEWCGEGYFNWTELDCPGGAGASCCLPQGDCGAVGGYCSSVEGLCQSGFAPWEEMGCPGESALCCVPLQ